MKRINEMMLVGFLACLFIFTVVFLSGCPSDDTEDECVLLLRCGKPEPCVVPCGDDDDSADDDDSSDDDDSASDDDDSSVSDDDDSGE